MRSVVVSLYIDPNTVSLRSPVVGHGADREQMIEINCGNGVRCTGWIGAYELGRALFGTEYVLRSEDVVGG